MSGTVDYLARFVCADLAAYQTLTTGLIDDPSLGVARIVSHVALRPIRRFTGYRPLISLDLLLEMTIRDHCERMGIPCPVGVTAA